MQHIKKLLWVLCGLSNCCFAHPSSPPSISLNSTQLIVVQTLNRNVIEGKLQRFSRESTQQSWKKTGKLIPVVIGKQGIGLIKREGDGRTPAGAYAIGPIFGFNKKFNNKMIYVPITDDTICVDDIQSPYYNQILNSRKTLQKNWHSAEFMRQIPQYRLGAVIQYNISPTRKGAGSCIFLHIWKNPTSGTAGCIAMEESNLKKMLNWFDARKHPVIAIFPIKAASF